MPDRVERYGIAHPVALGEFERAEGAVQQHGALAFERQQGEAALLGAAQQLARRDGAQQVVALGSAEHDGEVAAVPPRVSFGEGGDARDVRHHRGRHLGGHAAAQREMVGLAPRAGAAVRVGHRRRW